MPNVLLLHTNTEYATSLSDTIASLDTEYDVDVISREPLRTRACHLLDDKYDLVQVDELLVNGVLAWGGSVLSGTPFVVAIRGWADYTNAHDQYGRLRNFTIQLRSKLVLRAASETVFLSERTLKEFSQHYSVGKSSVIGRPIDIDYYEGADRQQTHPRNTDGFELLTVTNLRYVEKFEGVKTILQGLSKLFEQHPDLRYSIAGNGTYRESLEQFLETYPYTDRVNVLGYREDIPQLLANADAFVYVSFLDAYPTVVLEAQAAGLPVVGGDAVGVPEVVGEAGLICSATPDGIEDAVGRIITDQDLRAELSEKSVSKMETYNEKCARRHIEVWDDVLGYSR